MELEGFILRCKEHFYMWKGSAASAKLTVQKRERRITAASSISRREGQGLLVDSRDGF